MRIIAMLGLLAMCSVGSAHADSFNCRNYADAKTDEVRAEIAPKCIRDLTAELADATTSLARGRQARMLAVKIAVNDAAIFEVFTELAETRARESLGLRWQGVFNVLRMALDPGWNDIDDSFADLRAKYADPETLKSFYAKTKSTLLGKIALLALKGIASDALTASLPLLTKPVSPIAAQSMDWYHKECWKAEDELYEDNRAACKKLQRTYAAPFRKDYGVEPDGSNSYALGWLYRRYLEGGKDAVSAWQSIGLDLANDFALISQKN